MVKEWGGALVRGIDALGKRRRRGCWCSPLCEDAAGVRASPDSTCRHLDRDPGLQSGENYMFVTSAVQSVVVCNDILS